MVGVAAQGVLPAEAGAADAQTFLIEPVAVLRLGTVGVLGAACSDNGQ